MKFFVGWYFFFIHHQIALSMISKQLAHTWFMLSHKFREHNVRILYYLLSRNQLQDLCLNFCNFPSPCYTNEEVPSFSFMKKTFVSYHCATTVQTQGMFWNLFKYSWMNRVIRCLFLFPKFNHIELFFLCSHGL